MSEIDETRRFREHVKLRVTRYLLEHPCVSCAQADPVVLEFHHRDPSAKVSNISNLVARMASAARIDAEIAKCEVLCANCHQRGTNLGRARHYKLGWWMQLASGDVKDPRQAANVRNARLAWDRLEEGYCVDCGEIDVLVLQFDHRERKTTDVSRLVGNGCSASRLADELAKCDIRCASCHRRRTAERGGWYRTRQVAAVPAAVTEQPVDGELDGWGQIRR
ncbi:MAG TPA: hypothetical protein VKV73_00170 [Chloroflexota bacterium]|nr:hypothetical protein [Chloroflexota bacterium]